MQVPFDKWIKLTRSGASVLEHRCGEELSKVIHHLWEMPESEIARVLEMIKVEFPSEKQIVN